LQLVELLVNPAYDLWNRARVVRISGARCLDFCEAVCSRGQFAEADRFVKRAMVIDLAARQHKEEKIARLLKGSLRKYLASRTWFACAAVVLGVAV
jgi:hypothetical protein